MKIPDIPPKIQVEEIKAILEHMLNPEVEKYIAVANDKYLHWDQIRRRPIPANLSLKQAWTAIKLSRLPRRIMLPLLDSKGTAFSYWLPAKTLSLLHEVDRWGGSVLAVSNEATSMLETEKDRLIAGSLMEEAIATAQIEGAVTTRQVAKQMLATQRKPRNRHEQMILNSYKTIKLIHQRLGGALNEDLLFELQEVITDHTMEDIDRVGRYRSEKDQIRVVDVSNAEVVFVPPPAEDLRGRMQIFFDFVNSQSHAPFLHPLVKATIIHFWLAYEHPFVDGNGRTARALFYWYMLKQGYLLFEFLTISKAILAAPVQYYRSFLYTENDDNDLTYFIMHQLNMTHEAISSLHRYLSRKREEQKGLNASLRRLTNLNQRQRICIAQALRDSAHVFTFQAYMTEHGVTYVTARSDLLKLAEKGLLRETRVGKQRAFLPAKNLKQLVS